MKNKFLGTGIFSLLLLSSFLFGGNFSQIVGASPEGRYIIYSDRGQFNTMVETYNDAEYIYDVQKARNVPEKEKIAFPVSKNSDWQVCSFTDTSELMAPRSVIALFSAPDKPAGQITLQQNQKNINIFISSPSESKARLLKTIKKKRDTWLRLDSIAVNPKMRQIFTIFWVDEVDNAGLRKAGLGRGSHYSDFSFGYCQAYSFRY